MDYILNFLGLGSLVSSLSSTIMWIAIAWVIFQFSDPLKNLWAAIVNKIAEYAPGVTDYFAEGTSGLKVLAVPSIVVLVLAGAALYYTGKVQGCNCDQKVQTAITDLRQTYKFVKR